MKSFSIIAAAAAVLVAPVLAEIKVIGCYKTSEGVTLKATSVKNSRGFCGTDTCTKNAAFAMTAAEECYCGDMIPADVEKVALDRCNLNCPGYPNDNCGGSINNVSYYMFYDNGVANNIPKSDPVALTSSVVVSSTTSTKATTSTRAAQDSQTASASSRPSQSSAPSSGPNKAGIAAGVVIGVVAIAGIMGGIFFFMKNRKRRALEEEHRRNAEINNFSKPPTTAGSNPFNDTRLDPVMAQRRMSDGSIADNQDYSRRILKVTNA